jgi:uncharacterized protein (TIGR02217 family)
MRELFLNCRFPQEGCNFLKHSVEFFTNVQMTKNGSETRVILNDFGKSQFKLEPHILSLEKINKIYHFFQITKGRGNSFRFFDSLDCNVKNGNLYKNENNQLFITKRYKYQNYFVDKVITKPVEDTVLIKHEEDLLYTNQDYKINYLTGEIIILNQNVNYENCFIDCDFDIEVRFESDLLSIEKDYFGNYYFQNLSLIQVI